MKLVWIALLPINLLFTLMVTLKNWFYNKGLVRIRRLKKPVISIGNLSMGGTGKSPLTSEITRMLSKMGYKVAILSRGYGRRSKNRTMEVLPDTCWMDSGDEPLMIARQNPKARVFVGPTRYKAAALSRTFNPDIFLIDDGFQHRQLFRDVDIVLIDATQPIPPHFLALPFREGLISIKRASLVIITRCPEPEAAQNLIQQIKLFAPETPICFSHFKAGPIQPILQSHLASEQKVVAYSGIERPEKFFTSLKELGYELPFSLSLGDHQAPSQNHWDQLISKAEFHNTSVILTTEKDAVKVEKLPTPDIMLGFLPLETHWEDTQSIKTFLSQILKQETS